jgi:branched-chain amino acid transport system substrate-binding protein
MTKKITKSGSISRRRLLPTVSAGTALAASPFRINCCKRGRDAFSL